MAVIDFMIGPLVGIPQQVRRPLRGDLAGLHPAPVGAYRVVHEIDDDAGAVDVLHIGHRADIYRPR